MSRLKVKQLVSQVSSALSRAAGKGAERWRHASPGLRYALVYFLCVLVIAGLVWWQFSPAAPLIFEPKPPGQQTGEDPENEPEDTDALSLAALASGETDLALPLAGDVLLGCGQAFSGALHQVTAGIHVSGRQGDPVRAAAPGKVERVIGCTEFGVGEVWLTHGDFGTRYINLGLILVAEGDAVSAGQVLAELGAKPEGSYVCDYLVFELWDNQGEPIDPLEFIDRGR